ncbi:uncharacterized protein LOC124115795 [Haliotis rufescens]|uniref:uncharacterized protein LOC124115795 n=1 Tax=Haliotis rufescens TaxID=6454 RepID=UPI00201F07AE|nr:uncharacterized protein LOC124115795 [Haliotis rufescens]
MLLSLGTLLVAQFLGGHAQSLAPGVFDPNCRDHLDNCKEFHSDTCINALFEQWVFDNCRQHCKLCIGPTTPVTTTPTPPCIDEEIYCYSYPDDMCSKDLYRVWAEANCRKTCGFCGVIQVVPTPAIG